MQDWFNTVFSQYANSPTMLQTIGQWNAAIDPQADLNQFYSLIWNVSTAQGYGLDVWGRIVGVTRVLTVTSSVYFGFAEAGSSLEAGFNQAPFYSGSSSTSNFALSDSTFLTLIYAKALANITNGSSQSINTILMTLFGSQGNCWVQDNENMTINYCFNFTLSAVDQAIIAQSGVLPRAPGVAATILNVTPGIFNDGGVVALTSPPSGYPTSNAGLAVGALWSNGGLICVAGTTTPSGSAPPVYFASQSAVTLLALGGANLPLTNPGVGSGIIWNANGVVSVA
jgi:hypothetical protein